MKRILALSALLAVCMTSCDKDDDPQPTVETPDYQPTTANSTWTYHVNNISNSALSFDFTLKASSKDSSINGRTYKVFTNTSGDNEYYTSTGKDYFQYAGFAGITNAIELTYLKDADLGATWTETKSVTVSGIPLTPTFTYSIAEVLPTYTVSGMNFTNVKKVHVSLSIPGLTIPSTDQDLNFYYADGVGRIKSQIKLYVPLAGLNANNETLLTTYTIAP